MRNGENSPSDLFNSGTPEEFAHYLLLNGEKARAEDLRTTVRPPVRDSTNP